MDLRRKILIIVVMSVLLTVIPASLFVYQYAQTKVLANELADLVSRTHHQTSMVSQRLAESKPKLEALASLLKKELSAPIKPNEIQSFHDEMELNVDGVWRNRLLGFDGHTEAGVFLPPNPNESEQQKIVHMRIKHVVDYFGSAANERFENVWYMSPDRSKIIFDNTYPNFSFEQQADNDYTTTPWVTYTSPKYNPSRQFIFTPALYDPVTKQWMVSALYPLYLGNIWLGSLGEDIQLSNVLGSMLSEQQKYQETQHFLVDNNGRFILAGDWQATLEAKTEPAYFELVDEPELTKLLNITVGDKPTILSDNVVVAGKHYVAVGMSIAPAGWHYYKLVSVDDILHATHQLFWGLIGLIFLACLMSAVFISVAVDRSIVQRLMRLAEALRLYESGTKCNLTVSISGSDEIALAAKEFDIMAERIDQNIIDLNKAAETLTKNEERWNFALESAEHGVWDWNIKTGEVLFSKQWKQMLGYEENEFPNQISTWQAHLHPEDKSRVLQCLKDYINKQRPNYEVEYRLRCKEGSWKWILARGMVVGSDRSLAAERMIGTQTDISLQKNIENQLRQNSEQLLFMLENSPIAVRIAVVNGSKVIFANKAYEALVNLTDKSIIGFAPQDYYVNPNDYLDTLANLAQGTSIKNKLVELTIPSCGNRWVLASYLTIEYKQQRAVLGWFYDITEQLEAEESLKLHASVFENAWEGIMITNAQNMVISINSAFSNITGYQPADILGKNPKLLNSGQQDARFYQQMWQSITNTGHWRGEMWNRKKNGELYVEMLSISAVKDAHNNITHYVGVFADITDIKNTEKRLEKMAHYDPLTNLPNRVLLADRLSQNIAQATRADQLLVVCFLDLDNFKAINDEHGHDVGDNVLIEVAKRLSALIRTGDTVARMGGDEFVVLLNNVMDLEELELAMDRLNGIIAQPMNIAGIQFNITTSIGLTIFPTDNTDADTLLRHADLAMYEAKQAGRSMFKLFDAKLDLQVHHHYQIVARIRLALENKEFCLFYQPKVNLRTGSVVGLEALIRWQHPERGLLGPFEFLPMIESNELIVQIGDWVIEQALSQILSWQNIGQKIPVSVNVAAKQMQNILFTDKLEHVLSLYPELGPELLELEILETSALETVQTAAIVRNIKNKLGVSFALDDFGTGYSSLAYLKQLPAETLKIDQSFVRDMLVDMEDQAIVEGVIKLAKVFKRSVIAEGVETDAHSAKLLELGCDVVQGYGIAKPMPAEAVFDWIDNYQHSRNIKR